MSTQTSPQSLETVEFVPAGTPGEAVSQNSGWREYFTGVFARMVALFLCYILSIGPMYWHWYSGKFVNGSQTIAAFYEPLWQLSHRYPWFGQWVDHYVRLWQG